jgi:hypothetical protein
MSFLVRNLDPTERQDYAITSCAGYAQCCTNEKRCAGSAGPCDETKKQWRRLRQSQRSVLFRPRGLFLKRQ